MTEITAVPIKPVAKGSLTKLWIGVALAIAVGGGLAWSAIPRGVDLDTETAGTGPMPKQGDVVFLNYKGTLVADGTVFDESRDIPLPVEGIFPKGTPFPVDERASIPGFYEGLQQMQKGGKYTLFIPSDKAYGAEGSSNPQTGELVIPPNADLEFEIEVIEVMSEETFQRNLGILQQAMQSQQGAPGGAPGAAPGAAPGQ
jgi:FKBP-type peptidyl-prolyl cis-trans isomerase FkpA